MSEVGKEQAITNKINQLVEKYREMTIEREAPNSLEGASLWSF